MAGSTSAAARLARAVLGTYLSALIVCAASLAVGQAALVVCGWRRWSWLAPAVGVALLLAVAWVAVRLPGENATALAVIAVLTALAAAVLWRARPDGAKGALREGLPAAGIVLAGASIPFFVEGHFGVLGTSFNPDMGQQLFAADWLVDSNRPEPDLFANGYPVGPHALAAALTTVNGGNLVSAFSGLTIAIPVLAALTSLTVLRDLAPLQRAIGAALVGLPYLAASYLAQGLPKELLQALFIVAFALCLHELARGEHGVRGRRGVLVAVPLGLIAIGSVYAYSAPGLVWIVGTVALFGAPELVRGARSGRAAAMTIRRALVPAAVAVAVLVAGAAPELGRMLEFRGTAVDVARAEKPDESAAVPQAPAQAQDAAGGDGSKEAGPGAEGGSDTSVQFDNQLGNLFEQISPLEALGVWPTGDFRLEPGAGAAPAAFFYACALLAALALVVGLVRWLGRGETAVPAALLAALAVYVAARIASTPYTAAKAALMIAPLATLVPVRELLASGPAAAPRSLVPARAGALLGIVFVIGAGFSSLLALANAPVGPRDYSPGLTLLRSAVIDEPVLVLAPESQIADEHAEQFIDWELRGVVDLVVEAGGGETRPGRPPAGIRYVITGRAGPSPPYAGAELVKRVEPYRLWVVGAD